MGVKIPNGVFPCVSLSGGVGTIAVRQGDPRFAGWLVVYRFPYADPEALTELARYGLPAGSPCFPNLYVLDGLTWLAYHDGAQQQLRNMATGKAMDGVPGLSNPSAFGAGYFAYTEPVQPYRVHRLNLRTAEVDQPRLGAPTGLSRILDDGSVVTIDEDRHALPGATIPSFAGPLAVGEGPDGGAVWAHSSGAKGILYKGLTSYTPKCANDGDILAITTAGPDVRLFCGPLAALLVASGVIPQREKGPINTEEKEPMQAKPLDADVHAIVVELHARHSKLANGSDEDRRTLQLLICETVCARKGRRWGWKSNHGVNIANAKDAIAQIPDGDQVRLNERQPLYIWDLFNGSTRKPNPLPLMSGPEHEAAQFFVPVEPIDHLAGIVAPPVPSQPPAPSPVDLGPLTAEVSLLREAIDGLKADVDYLKKRPELNVSGVQLMVDAALTDYEVNGRTGRDRLGLQHDVKLAITKRKP